MTLRDLADTVGFIDPAASKSVVTRQRDSAAICVVQQDQWRRVFVRVAWRGRVTTDQLTEEVFRVNAIYLPRPFGCEANAMQILYGDSLVREARQRQVTLHLMPVWQPPAQKKEWRIRAALQTLIHEGRLFLGEEHTQLREDLLVFPQQANAMDLVDALASAVTLLPSRPLPIQAADQRRALASHLRRQGVPPAIIQQRVAALQPSAAGGDAR